MATLTSAMLQVKSRLDEYLPENLILRICAELQYHFRKRKLEPVTCIQLFLLQLLANVGLRGLVHTSGVEVSAQAICHARMKLPLALFARLLEQSVPEGVPELFRGLKVYIADGMGFMIPDNPRLAGKFGKPGNQRGESHGYPAGKMLALLETGGGFFRRAILLPCKRHEFTCLARLFKSMVKASLLMGDRGLVSFTHLLLLTQNLRHGCFQLPRGKVVTNRGRGSRKLKKRLGKQDLLVEWTACRCPKWLSARRWKKLKDQTLTLRQISFRVCRKGHRTRWAWIITTLLDPKQYPAQELIELYSQRWQIEVDFRDLKRTLNLHRVSAKTIAGVHKEVLSYLLLYNLIRAVMQDAAKQQKVPPDRISFTNAMLWILYAMPGSSVPKLEMNLIRKRKTQPRRVKTARHRYPALKQSRELSCVPPCVVKI
jgi:Transposase DDE domain